MSCSDWVPPTPGHLRVLRTDAAVTGQVCAGVEVAKARRLLTFFIDETELNCSSVQSMITTIENEHGQVKSIALDGISLLEKKTAEVATDATIRTFYAGASVRRQDQPRHQPAGRDERASLAFSSVPSERAPVLNISHGFCYLFFWLD